MVAAAALADPVPHDHFTRLQRRHGAMNPETKIILDELTKKFAEQDTKFE